MFKGQHFVTRHGRSLQPGQLLRQILNQEFKTGFSNVGTRYGSRVAAKFFKMVGRKMKKGNIMDFKCIFEFLCVFERKVNYSV